jgi:beta-alanine degradation protein BauB
VHPLAGTVFTLRQNAVDLLGLYGNDPEANMKIAWLLLISLTASVVSAQDPVKVDTAHYRVVFENAHMRVVEVRDKPGEKEPMHSHPVYMTYVTGPDKTKITLPDGRTILDEDKASAFPCHPPTQHATENIDTTDTQELMVEFKNATNPCSGAQEEVSASSSPMTRSEANVRDRLIGTWRLVSAGTFRPDGSFEPFPEYGPNAIGYLMYDPTGHMCVSLSNPNHPHWANPKKPTDAEKLRSYDAFFAYCGTYEIREKEGRVIHRPEMGSWPHYIGTDQNRNFRLEGERLILSDEETPPGGERRRYQITWERVAK